VFTLAAPPLFDVHPDSGVFLANRISTPGIRGMTLLDLASRAAARRDTSLARKLALAGIGAIDPAVQPIEGMRLAGLVRGGLYDVLLRWARSQSGPEQRARVFFALFEAVAAQ
jgi:hypothetical protein